MFINKSLAWPGTKWGITSENNRDEIEDRFPAFPCCDVCVQGACNKSLGGLFWQMNTDQIFTQAALRCFDACWCLHPCTFTLDQVLNHLKNNLNPAHANLFWQINARADQIPKQQLLHAAHRDYYPVKLNLLLFDLDHPSHINEDADHSKDT